MLLRWFAMTIIDPKIIQECRDRAQCELCYAGTAPYEAHHIYHRGMGGGSQLDVAINLICVCVKCHRLIHDGWVKRQGLLAAVAVREGISSQQVWERICELLRQPRPIGGS